MFLSFYYVDVQCKTSVIITLNSQFSTINKKKESFWLANVILLLAKRTPFAVQKDSFYNAKGLLLQTARFTS